jgi:hypothetical protein
MPELTISKWRCPGGGELYGLRRHHIEVWVGGTSGLNMESESSIALLPAVL